MGAYKEHHFTAVTHRWRSRAKTAEDLLREVLETALPAQCDGPWCISTNLYQRITERMEPNA